MTNQANNTVNTEATATETKPVFRAGTSRAVALELFTAKLPERSTLGNTEFRKAVIADMMEQQKMTLASAAATYNIVKKYAVAEELCEDFGRTPAEPKPAKAKKAKAEEPKEEAAPATVNVVRKKDGVAVAEGVTVAEAEELIEKARKGKKAALQIAE